MYRAKDATDFFDMVGQTAWQKDVQRTLIHWMGLRDQDEVLDVGCGAGHFILQLAQRVQWVTGFDVSETMLERAGLNASDHQLDNVNFAQGSVSRMPFPDGRFHLVICMNLLFMLEHPEQALQEMLRVTKSDGQIVLVNPTAAMNPWTVQTFCDVNRIEDFERDSLLSLATATARYGGVTADGLGQLVAQVGGTVADSLQLLDGFFMVSRIHKTSAAE